MPIDPRGRRITGERANGRDATHRVAVMTHSHAIPAAPLPAVRVANLALRTACACDEGRRRAPHSYGRNHAHNDGDTLDHRPPNDMPALPSARRREESPRTDEQQ